MDEAEGEVDPKDMPSGGSRCDGGLHFFVGDVDENGSEAGQVIACGCLRVSKARLYFEHFALVLLC